MTRDGKSSGVDRRSFLAASTAATMTILRPSAVRGTQANSRITLGLVGCGGRGRWLAKLFDDHGGYAWTACADYFLERVNLVGEQQGIAEDHRFTGLCGYEDVLSQPVDAVVIETPPYFHPAQAAAAVEAGKHVFLAKPIAVDAPGCLRIGEAGRRATEKGLVFLVDFQTRTNEYYQEAVRRVHDGAIGRIVSAEAHYPWQGNVHDVEIVKPDDRLQYWYQTLALSGDVIVEQDIHVLDVATWVLDDHPTAAVGQGGQSLRRHGNIWDHFSITFAFPEDRIVTFHSQKAVPGVPDEIRCRVFGSDGVMVSDYFKDVWIRGKNPYDGGSTGNLYLDGAVANINAFERQIRDQDASNPTVAPSVRSNLTCVLGRMAAYRREWTTWQEMLDQPEHLEVDLSQLDA